MRFNWHELAWDISVREHVSLQDACINLARAVEPINMSFVTRPFADSKVFGLEKAALAERPLSEVHWPKFALNKLACKHGSLLDAYAYLDFARAEEIDMGFANRALFVRKSWDGKVRVSERSLSDLWHKAVDELVSRHVFVYQCLHEFCKSSRAE